MPYIKGERRDLYDIEIDQLIRVLRQDGHRRSVGDLNYVITRLCDGFLDSRFRYANLNEVIGVLECAKQELYRRLAIPYEDEKCQENGDVYYAI